MVRVVVTTLLLIGQVLPTKATMDGWINTTPGGLEMRGGNLLTLAPGRFVCCMDKWYFYRGHVLGHFRDGGSFGDSGAPSDPSLQWVIVDERTSRVWTFTSTDAWENARDEMGLKPALWERWYRNDWHVLTNSFAMFLYAMLLAIPVLLLAGITVALVVINVLPVKYVWRGLVVIAVIYAGGVFLELFPQSI